MISAISTLSLNTELDIKNRPLGDTLMAAEEWNNMESQMTDALRENAMKNSQRLFDVISAAGNKIDRDNIVIPF